jgi:hypothetical protein
MSYHELSIDQRISLKGLIVSQRERASMGLVSHEYFKGLYALAILNRSYVESINMFLRA